MDMTVLVKWRLSPTNHGRAERGKTGSNVTVRMCRFECDGSSKIEAFLRRTTDAHRKR